MSEPATYTTEMFTKKKESNLAYNMEQNTDLWLVLLREYVLSNGEKSEFLKRGILDELDEWNALVQKAKKTHFEDLKDFIYTKPTRWRFSIRSLLADPVHASILETYLRTLIALRLKKINLAFGGEVKQKINRVLSFSANEAFSYLIRYLEIYYALQEGKTPLGSAAEGELKQYYESMLQENLNFLYIFLTIIVIFKSAHCTADITYLQTYIQENLVRPTEIRLASLDRKSDSYRMAKDKLESYQTLLRGTDISFE